MNKKKKSIKISQFDIYNPYENQEVTVDYIDVITQAIQKLDIDIEKIDDIIPQKKSNKGILVIAVKDVIKARKAGYSYVMLWTQGIVPEESYMRHSSWLRYHVISFIEKKGLQKADYVFMVSQEMKRHFENKYKIELKNYYLMPCFNEELEKENFECHDYSKNVFGYAGSLSKWQCFEETTQIYKKIEHRHPEAKFKVLTKQKRY
jgi:hypothetical protein